MVAPSKLARMDEKAKAFIAAHFAIAPLEAEMMELWSLYRDMGLPNDDFIAELTNGKRPSFAQRAWEMLLARHLHLEGHTCLSAYVRLACSAADARGWYRSVYSRQSGSNRGS
jgi:hypothetical protein